MRAFFIERAPCVIDSSILNVDVKNFFTDHEKIDSILSTIEVKLHLDNVARKTEHKKVRILCDELRIVAIEMPRTLSKVNLTQGIH